MAHGERIKNLLLLQKERERQLSLGFAKGKDPDGYRVDYASGDVRLQIRVEEFDRLGVLLDCVELTREKDMPDSAAGAELRAQAVRFTERADQPWGKFSMVEACGEEPRAILRTSPSGTPTSVFFELDLRGGTEASLRSYAVGPETNERVRVAANLSMAAFQALTEFLIEGFEPKQS
jgi:hypothetical protein